MAGVCFSPLASSFEPRTRLEKKTWRTKHFYKISFTRKGILMEVESQFFFFLTSFLFPRLLQAGRTWISSDCTKSCSCMGGTIQCRDFQCPPGTYCKNSNDGSSNCVKICKGAMSKLGGCARGRKSQRQGKKDLGPLGLKLRGKSYPSLKKGLWCSC